MMEDFQQIGQYRKIEAVKIALFGQKWWKGRRDRESVRQFIWLRFDRAARTIQRSWRRYYRLNNEFRWYKLKISRLRRRDNKIRPVPRVPKLDVQDNLTSVFNDDYTVEDKLAIWRFVIELRRAHPDQSIDSCIKALLESKGELSRACTLLGIPEFAVRHFTELPNSLRTTLVPDYFHLRSNKVPLHEKKAAKQKMNEIMIRKKELLTTILEVVKKSYFSNQHVGSKPKKTSKK